MRKGAVGGKFKGRNIESKKNGAGAESDDASEKRIGESFVSLEVVGFAKVAEARGH